ncbi:MAG: preprotein translocase subunit SecA, partial [bacterium]|nr:preprotein translocase subunit SecA [bacterium]
MDFLERTWEWIGIFFSGLISGFERLITGVFGSSNARYIKKLQSQIDSITELEPELEKLSDEELREKTVDFRRRLRAGETLDDILVEAFAVCREGGKRFLGMRHYDVQLIGGMVLHSGAIAEMVTGEGKTLVATLPAYLNALNGSVHVVTVNDYLARRDMEWMGPLFMGLGLTVGNIQSGMEPEEKQRAYACDITYGTNNEFGFDYLRDNMKHAAAGDKRYASYPRMQQVQGKLTYAIIDEVDNILIDEARTPLIISGPAHENVTKYKDADRVARALKAEKHFVVNEKDHTCSLTDEGVRDAEKLAGVESFYTAGNTEWPHLMDNALKAHHLYKKDVSYVVKEGRIIIVDEFTGRLMDGRQWSDGLHQAVEAKENVPIKEETQTLATVTLQNFFKLYGKLCGMTGTAMTEANEFWKIYGLDVIAIPTNRIMQRKEYPDAIYSTEKAKYRAVADDIERVNRWDVVHLKNGEEVWGTISKETDEDVTIQIKESKNKETISRSKIKEIDLRGRPVLVGTVSIEKSERISALLEKRGVKHEVLNAKHHQREAEIVSQAGREAAVTIATNMAGRGTDIILGGNPENLAWAKLQSKYETRLDVPREEWDTLVDEIDKEFSMSESGKHIRELGGLYVIGTERHDARRIDLQLRGRCGRQGDPGSSRFFLSLDDDLMRIFYGDWVKNMLKVIGMTEEDRIENAMITRRIEGAQKKREEHNFEVRKNLLEYDEVMDEQRKRIYDFRQRILDGDNCREIITDMIHEEVNSHIESFLDRDYGVESFAEYASRKLSTAFESPTQFRGMMISDAENFAKSEAERMAESDIIGAIDENLPDGPEDEESEWNWGAL